MKSIEEIKIELTLKKLAGGNLVLEDIEHLPINDDLRTFTCELGSFAAYIYAKYVDQCSHDETRGAAYRKPIIKRIYIRQFGE
jgi:hypothetical protein